MDNETVAPNKKKFPVIVVLGGVLAFALVITIFQYYQQQSSKSPEIQNLQTKELIETEKQMMTQVVELDEARTQNKAQGTSPLPQTLEQQIQELDALHNAPSN